MAQNCCILKPVIIRSKLSDKKIEERKWGISEARETVEYQMERVTNPSASARASERERKRKEALTRVL